MNEFNEALNIKISNEDEISRAVYNLCKVINDQINQYTEFKRHDDLSLCSTLAVTMLARAFALAPEGTHNTLTNTVVTNASVFSDLILGEDRRTVIEAWLATVKEQTNSGNESND